MKKPTILIITMMLAACAGLQMNPRFCGNLRDNLNFNRNRGMVLSGRAGSFEQIDNMEAMIQSMDLAIGYLELATDQEDEYIEKCVIPERGRNAVAKREIALMRGKMIESNRLMRLSNLEYREAIFYLRNGNREGAQNSMKNFTEIVDEATDVLTGGVGSW